MKIGQLRILVLVLLSFLGSGCTEKRLDFCRLLSVSEVQEFDPKVVSDQIGERGNIGRTRYCIYTNVDDEEVFLLSIGNATTNAPYEILQTYVPFMEGDNEVEIVDGVGNTAGALFSDDYETDKFRILIANGDKWSVTVRAMGVSDKNSAKFRKVKELADKALSRF